MAERTLLLLCFLVLLGSAFGISIPPCEDGTPYYKCSEKNPGYLCLSSGLVFDDRNDGCCAKVGGKIVNGQCVILCSDGTKHGECSRSNDYGPPYYCNMGNLEKRIDICSCPENMEKQGNECVLKKGCVYNNPPCKTGQVCNKLSNTCIDLCDSSEVYNETTGKCVPKKQNSSQENTQPPQKGLESQKTDKIDNSILNTLGRLEENVSDSKNTSSGSSLRCCSSGLILLLVVASGILLIRK